MRAEQRHKSTELMPAGLELLPLVLPGGIVELAHYGETANVHAPKRDSAHGVVQTGGHLHAHIGLRVRRNTRLSGSTPRWPS